MNIDQKENSMTKKWCEKTRFEKVLDIISAIAFVVWMVFEVLEQKGMESAEMGAGISILVICICQAISYWNVKRAFSYVAIVGGTCLAAALILLSL